MSIAEELASREVTELLHFTTHQGLLGILHSGFVMSRKRLPHYEELEHIYAPNALIRRDIAWLDYINLSISEINVDFFQTSCRWRRNDDLWWSILAFDPVIAEHDGVYFATTNNMYTAVIRQRGVDGFRALFAPKVTRWINNIVVRPTSKASNLTTCLQAEVLYPGSLPLRYLKRIYVKTESDLDEVHSQLALTVRQSVGVSLAPSRFGDNEAE